MIDDATKHRADRGGSPAVLSALWWDSWVPAGQCIHQRVPVLEGAARAVRGQHLEPGKQHGAVKPSAVAIVIRPLAGTGDEATMSLRGAVLQHADHCFRDTDGITRDATRMLEIMARRRPDCSDREAGVRRNRAFDPDLGVVVTDDQRIRYPPGVAPAGEPSLLFTIVPRDRERAVRAPDATRAPYVFDGPKAAGRQPLRPTISRTRRSRREPSPPAKHRDEPRR